MAMLAASLEKFGTAGLTAEGLAKALEANRTAALASNPDTGYHPPSVFEPNGPDGRPLPKPDFVRTVFVNNHQEQLNQLKPEEVHAYNLLSASLPNPGAIRTSRAGKWKARVDLEGQRLYISFPSKGEDDRMNGPKGIIALCKELTDGTTVENVDSMLTKLMALEAQNKAIMALLSNRPELAAAAGIAPSFASA